MSEAELKNLESHTATLVQLYKELQQDNLILRKERDVLRKKNQLAAQKIEQIIDQFKITLDEA